MRLCKNNRTFACCRFIDENSEPFLFGTAWWQSAGLIASSVKAAASRQRIKSGNRDRRLVYIDLGAQRVCSRNGRFALRRGVWRAHHVAWIESELNQREYREAYGIPLKAFGNWRAKFKSEPQQPARKMLYRRGGPSHALSHGLRHGLNRDLGSISIVR
jgi:hypothetical protein